MPRPTLPPGIGALSDGGYFMPPPMSATFEEVHAEALVEHAKREAHGAVAAAAVTVDTVARVRADGRPKELAA